MNRKNLEALEKLLWKFSSALMDEAALMLVCRQGIGDVIWESMCVGQVLKAVKQRKDPRKGTKRKAL